MLSFFRKKSNGTIDVPTVDGIIPKMEQLSTQAPSLPQHDVSAGTEATLMDSSELAQTLGYSSVVEMKETIYGACTVFFVVVDVIPARVNNANLLADILRTIKDPEKPQTLEDLSVVYEEGIFVKDPTSDNVNVVSQC